MTEQSILEILHNKYKDTAKYKVSNVYLFNYGETDFFIQQNSSKYCYDIEIKCTRADFFNDFKKKDKHSILKEGFTIDKKGKQHVHNLRPNKFFFCVPENLIKIEEIPSYAGLMYIKDNNVFTI